MSLLSYTEILALVDTGVIKNAEYLNINSSSLDIRLGETLLIEGDVGAGPDNLLYLEKKSKLNTQSITLLPESQYAMAPGEFILAHSVEIFNLPDNISAEYKLKSSMARMGLDHLNAGWCDAGWTGSVLTLELKNVTQRHRIVLTRGDKIGQIVFFKHTKVPADKSYLVRGSYNNDTTVSGVKTGAS